MSGILTGKLVSKFKRLHVVKTVLDYMWSTPYYYIVSNVEGFQLIQKDLFKV